MRYLLLLLFAFFLVFSIDFATQNTINVFINYNIDWLNFNFTTEKPIFVPIFFSFSFGIIFSVFYFFMSHAILLRKLRLKKKEIKKIESILEKERQNNKSLVEQSKEMQQNAQSGIDSHESQESLLLDDVSPEYLKK